MSMLLPDQVAVIYGAGGALGGAVARAFAGAGAAVFVTGRTGPPVDELAEQIRAGGGTAEAACVDAQDERAVEEHIRGVVERTGRIDISLNLVGVDHIQGRPLLEMEPADFTKGIEARVRTQFATVRAAARHMVDRRSGVILMVTATPDRLAIPRVGSFGVACGALEALCRTLATELGPHGIRVVCLRSAGTPDAHGVEEAWAVHAANSGATPDQYGAAKAERALLGRMPRLHEVADAAVLMASPRAGAITAAITNVTCGEQLD
jgi:3-oxoacyl-[acyl-carrier protein] reductase